MLRIGLLLLAATALGGGSWALFLPRAFYATTFRCPAGLLLDPGPLQRAPRAGLRRVEPRPRRTLLVRGRSARKRLVQASLVAWLVYATPHFIFHLTQIHHFSPGDNLAQLGTLGFVILLPLVLLALAGLYDERRARAGHVGENVP